MSPARTVVLYNYCFHNFSPSEAALTAPFLIPFPASDPAAPADHKLRHQRLNLTAVQLRNLLDDFLVKLAEMNVNVISYQ